MVDVVSVCGSDYRAVWRDVESRLSGAEVVHCDAASDSLDVVTSSLQGGLFGPVVVCVSSPEKLRVSDVKKWVGLSGVVVCRGLGAGLSRACVKAVGAEVVRYDLPGRYGGSRWVEGEAGRFGVALPPGWSGSVSGLVSSPAGAHKVSNAIRCVALSGRLSPSVEDLNFVLLNDGSSFPVFKVGDFVADGDVGSVLAGCSSWDPQVALSVCASSLAKRLGATPGEGPGSRLSDAFVEVFDALLTVRGAVSHTPHVRLVAEAALVSAASTMAGSGQL